VVRVSNRYRAPIKEQLLIIINSSQAAPQGLAVLMASASVVLKHETSTLRQRHNFISIDLEFGVSDKIREVTSPAKFGSGPMSGQDGQTPRVVNIYGYCDFFYFLFLHSSTKLQPIPVNQC